MSYSDGERIKMRLRGALRSAERSDLLSSASRCEGARPAPNTEASVGLGRRVNAAVRRVSADVRGVRSGGSRRSVKPTSCPHLRLNEGLLLAEQLPQPLASSG